MVRIQKPETTNARIQIERHGDRKSYFKIVIAHTECFPNLTAFLQL